MRRIDKLIKEQKDLAERLALQAQEIAETLHAEGLPSVLVISQGTLWEVTFRDYAQEPTWFSFQINLPGTCKSELRVYPQSSARASNILDMEKLFSGLLADDEKDDHPPLNSGTDVPLAPMTVTESQTILELTARDVIEHIVGPLDSQNETVNRAVRTILREALKCVQRFADLSTTGPGTVYEKEHEA